MECGNELQPLLHNNHLLGALHQLQLAISGNKLRQLEQEGGEGHQVLAICQMQCFKHELKISGDVSSQFPCTSDAFSLKYSTAKGRCVMAARPVEVGDVVGVEEPYCAVLHHDQLQSFCYHCFKDIQTIYPCRSCSLIVYCSRLCEGEAWQKYHSAECKFLAWTIHPTVNSQPSSLGRHLHLALHTSLKAGPEALIQHHGVSVACEPLKRGFNKSGQYVNDYSSVYHLATNKEQRELRGRMHHVLMAAMMLELLESTGYFNALSLSMDVGEYKRIFAASLVHHMQAIQCNAYGIAKSDENHHFESGQVDYVGTGLYPTLSLINHSCDPALDIVFQGNRAVYRSFTNVAQGQEITVDYGPIYYLMTRAERQEELMENFYFECCCEPCVKYWPVWQDIESKIPRFKCPTCGHPVKKGSALSDLIKCQSCDQEINLLDTVKKLQKSHESYARVMEQLKGSDAGEEVLTVLKLHFTLMERSLCLPWKEYISCQAALDRCFKMAVNI